MTRKKPWASPGGVVITVRSPAHDNRRKWQADVAAKLEAMRHAYETSLSDGAERIHHLLGALIMCRSSRPLPDWLFTALKELLVTRLPQEPDLHLARWLMVCEGKQNPDEHGKKRSWGEAYDYASEKLADTPWAGSDRTMKASYQIHERKRRERQRRAQ